MRNEFFVSAMPPFNFPKGIDDKLALDEPREWDVEAFKGYDRMAVARGNAALRRIFAETRTDLPKLIASVRWSELRAPYKDFARACGMSSNGYQPMERDLEPRMMPHRSKYTRLLAHWKRKGISTGVREQLLDLLTAPELLELDDACADLLSAVEHVRSQSLDVLGPRQMHAFYQRVGYDCGHATVERSFPSLYNTVWQRESTGVVPSCLEVVSLIDTVYAGRGVEMRRMHALRRAQGEAIWRGVKKNQYLERTIEEPLAEFLVTVEKDLATSHGLTLTAETLREQYGFGHLHAGKLIQNELIEVQSIRGPAKNMMSKNILGAFFRQWNAAYTAERRRKSFGALASIAMDERGYTAADVAKLLNVQAPEQRGKAAPEKRSQRYRSDGEVRSVLFHNHVSRQISVEALVRVLARDETHAGELRDAYVRERERHFRRTGAALSGRGLTMRIMRELANVEMKELALRFLPPGAQKNPAAVREKDLELQRLERAEGKNHRITYGHVFRILERLAADHEREAMERIDTLDTVPESLKSFSTVQQMAANLIAAMKGATFVSDAMRNIATDDSLWLRSDLITKMAQGTFVGALPPLRVMTKGVLDAALPEEVVRDWHTRFPEELQKGVMEFGMFTRPLPRVLCTLIATKDADPMRFFERRVPGMVPTSGTRYLRDLERDDPVEWKYIHKILLAAGLQPSAIAYRLAKGLHDGGSVPTVVATLIPELVQQKQEVHPVSLPGLTLQDLPHPLRFRFSPGVARKNSPQ